MRSTAIVALALAAVAAPAFAYPSAYTPHTAARSELSAREINDIIARSFLSDFWGGFKKGFVGTLETVGPIVAKLLRREDMELLSREDHDLLMRSFGSDFVDGFKKGFVGTLKTVGPLVLGLLKREDLAVLARSGETDLFSMLKRENFDLLARDALAYVLFSLISATSSNMHAFTVSTCDAVSSTSVPSAQTSSTDSRRASSAR